MRILDFLRRLAQSFTKDELKEETAYPFPRYSESH